MSTKLCRVLTICAIGLCTLIPRSAASSAVAVPKRTLTAFAEGRMRGDSIREVRRTSFAPPIYRSTNPS
jgi:hypothetical protein